MPEAKFNKKLRGRGCRFFLRRVLDSDSEIALDLAHLVFSSPFRIIPISGKETERIEKEKEREKKERRKKGENSFGRLKEIRFIGIIYRKYYLYRMKRFFRPFLSSSRESNRQNFGTQ